MSNARQRFRQWRIRLRQIAGAPEAIARLEGQVEELRRENDQLRRDSLRIAELSDVVVERLSEFGTLPPPASRRPVDSGQ